jgi:hypothetical protein
MSVAGAIEYKWSSNVTLGRDSQTMGTSTCIVYISRRLGTRLMSIVEDYNNTGGKLI